MTKTELQQKALELSAGERFDLAQTLWESISPEEELRAVPLHDWQKKALDEAILEYETHPDQVVPVEVVLSTLREKLSSA